LPWGRKSIDREAGEQLGESIGDKSAATDADVDLDIPRMNASGGSLFGTRGERTSHLAKGVPRVEMNSKQNEDSPNKKGKKEKASLMSPNSYKRRGKECQTSGDR